jgi:hypothetical protein
MDLLFKDDLPLKDDLLLGKLSAGPSPRPIKSDWLIDTPVGSGTVDWTMKRSLYSGKSDDPLIGRRLRKGNPGYLLKRTGGASPSPRGLSKSGLLFNMGQQRIERVGPAMVAEQRMLLASAELDANDEGKMRELALLHQVISNHPLNSGNSIFDARNSVAEIFLKDADDRGWSSTGHATEWIRSQTPPGATASPYTSIHHNFSRDTPKNVAAFINEWMFPLGPTEQRAAVFIGLVDAMSAARAGNPSHALLALEAVLQNREAAKTLAPLKKLLKEAGAEPDRIADALRDFLKQQATKDLGKKPEEILLAAARVYRAVCADQPTADRLWARMFKAGEAWPEVADVVAQMRAGKTLGTLVDLGEARLAVRDSIIKAKTGYERQEQLQFDQLLDRLTCQELGTAVDRVGNMRTHAQRHEALIAIQTALRSAVATGLDALKDNETDDALAKKGRPIRELLAEVDAALKDGVIGTDGFRALMCEVHASVTCAVQSIRSLMDRRGALFRGSGISIDDRFNEQLMKQTPLHYATALASKGMRAGLKEVIGPRCVSNVTGMDVLHSIGPVVFPSVVFADNAADLAELDFDRSALIVVFNCDEKKMKMAGGVLVDIKDAPGGQSHLVMYSSGNGLPAVALPDLSTKYSEFFKNASKEGGIYIDDRGGQFQMMTVAFAKEQGLITDASAKELLPGVNRRVKILKPGDGPDLFEVVAQHTSMISPLRPTRDIEVYAAVEEVQGLGRTCTSFKETGAIGVQARHLAGEKGTVLSLLANDPELSKYVPDGSIVSTGRVRSLLREAGIYDECRQVWFDDPTVGVVTDDNFLESAFYNDPEYRKTTRAHLQQLTHQGLDRLLVEQDAKGGKKLTAAGQKLYQELLKNPGLAKSTNWIARSSFTAEDRPGKSGAGQYESFEDLTTPAERIEGIIKVIASGWDHEPVENNVTEQFNLQYIEPSVTVMHCLKPDISGALVSYDKETGARDQVDCQLVKGYGGGVSGGEVESALLTRSGVQLRVKFPGETGSLADDTALKELRELVLKIEKFFNEKVEPGKGYPVDVEVARENGQWYIVQARVAPLLS